MEANRIEGVTSKAPQLVLQASAIIGNKASPKVLIQFMKAMTTYFDQTPGTYSILRNYLKYVMSEISSGRPSIEVPMERNDYANDLPSPLILSKYLKIQSQAFIQVLNVNYSRIILATKELRTINATSCPEQFAASNSCMMEVFRWLVVYHGGQAASYRRQLKIMLENVNGLLSQKPSVASIRQVLKDVVICGSALGKHIGGRSYTQSIIVARGNVSP
jgi:hypothetical protein